ncbi:MAG TPA: type II secretion system minor pseudopilin GspI [Candidatus Competibacteraceae bacterium]|nr:type II secretion system minor pseudopilin GspI [Candidatus Competibacteraceae bacterium]HRZ04933.1 type II secretion system minor pseudopilin GspI [Candidatus Competibacteraceae bacterium]HSA45355.1 type II secretion system minor pseudopilin GspI [Candidatus Competibacteraceae bacterium]
MRRVAGFTLLEVLVALAVLAIAMGAIINVATQSIANTAYLRDQTFASWIALNQVNQRLLDSEPWPEEGSRDGSVELANRAWRWQVRFAKTDDPDLRRMEVTVRVTENSSILSKLTAFKANPPQRKPADDQVDPSTQDQSPKNSSSKDQSRTTPRAKTP